MSKTTTANRCVRLTDEGVKRLQAVRRQYRSTVEDITVDPGTPSINTVKRTLKQQPVFVSTLERIWDYFRRRAAEAGERLPYLEEGQDYIYDEDGTVEAEARPEPSPSPASVKPAATVSGGWLSRTVPRPNRLFTGREDVLARLHEALQDSSATLVSDPQAISGLGGIGKTQTAIAYIYRYWRDYSRVFWVSAATAESIDDGLSAIAEEIGLLPLSPATKPQALRMIHDWFAWETGWLLILDNADDIDALVSHFPRHHTGRLILTTRARSAVKWASPIVLQRFSPEVGALLLLRRAGILDVRQPLEEAPAEVLRNAISLSEELDGLPLALDQAGAYLAETGSAIADYHARYREQGLRFLDSSAEPEHPSVAATFRLAIQQMADHTLYGQEAAEVVSLCGFLVPEEIPESIFGALFSTPDGKREVPLDEVLAAVTRFSLLARNAATRTLTMHRLVQRLIQDDMDPRRKREWRERAVNAVSGATPDFEYEQWALCDQLLPQWRTCVHYIAEDGIRTAEAAHLLYQTGRYLRARALYDEAARCTRQALSIAEDVYGCEHPTLADYADELACLCRTMDLCDEAERLHARAIGTLKQLHGPYHVSLTSKLHNLALLYYQAERYDEAEKAFLRALSIHAKQKEPDRFVLAATLTQLAGVYRIQGEFARAEEYCRAALDTYEQILPAGHVDLATANNNLALLYLTTGSLDEAEEYYQRALLINKNTRGADHPETAHVVWGLARVRWRQGRREEADRLFG